jgi:hypothetical protein
MGKVCGNQQSEQACHNSNDQQIQNDITSLVFTPVNQLL